MSRRQSDQPVPYELPWAGRGIIPPEDGWKPNTLYLVNVCFSDANPVHQAYFYSGFLNGADGGPGGYNAIWSSGYEQHKHLELKDVYYMRVLKALHSEDEL